ncbi:hypothetical protein NDU88_002103 [Pleurodeles waltl]|uniref:Uncharacterized protein n=1 Tax=Pleurodeles waltl TaxID=8319 RepID=A0AAV7W2E4_PLEWA|nr:hypothetical protein NDU88_002103 [Pleurodeles waltl]
MSQCDTATDQAQTDHCPTTLETVPQAITVSHALLELKTDTLAVDIGLLRDYNRHLAKRDRSTEHSLESTAPKMAVVLDQLSQAEIKTNKLERRTQKKGPGGPIYALQVYLNELKVPARTWLHEVVVPEGLAHYFSIEHAHPVPMCPSHHEAALQPVIVKLLY